VGAHELDEVNMPGSAPRDSEELEIAGGRKPPNPIAFPALLPAQERLLNTCEVAACMGVSVRCEISLDGFLLDVESRF
jgi:hypothetical protein